MRLTILLALILLSCLLLNLTSAQRSASERLIKTVGVPHLGPRHHVVRPKVEAQQGVGQMLNQQLGPRLATTKTTSTTTRRTTKKLPTKKSRGQTTRTSSRPSSSTTSSETSGSSRKPWKKLPKKKKNKTTTGTSDSSVPPTDVDGDSVSSTDEERDPVSANDEERDSVSTTKRIKAAAKKYLGKVKDKLQSAAIWFVENKDKTIDDILVDKWKEKCSGGISTKNKRKRCVSDALADSDDDTPEEKQVKDALKSLLEEDSDKAYEFLSTSSS